MKLKNPEELARQYDQMARRVLEDVTMKEEYQAEAIERLYNQTREQIQQSIDEERENLEVAVRVNRRLLMQPPDMPGNKDRALLYLLYNQHLTKLEEIDNVNALERYWQKVAQIGDEVGVRACLTRAIALSATTVVQSILSEHEDWQELYRAYVEAMEDLRDYSKSPHAFFGAGRLRTPREYLP